jgi:hypothetical protein
MRTCGDCQLCCKLVPVQELGKGAGERCRHQRAGKGCLVYRRPGRPQSCAWWTCRWLVNDDTADLRRPDRSHYVIDVMPDFVRCVNNETGESQPVPAVQIWVDPSYRDAHRDPGLRAYLERRAADGVVGIVRYSERDCFTLIAPAMAGDHQWHEVHRPAGVPPEPEHTLADKIRVFGGVRVTLADKIRVFGGVRVT